MSGTVIPHNTPWMRAAWRGLTPEALERIEALVPDGMTIGVGIYGGKPGSYRAWIPRPDEFGMTTEYGYPSIESAVRAVLEKAKVAA